MVTEEAVWRVVFDCGRLTVRHLSPGKPVSPSWLFSSVFTWINSNILNGNNGVKSTFC